MLGRELEIDLLNSALREAATGRVVTVLVSGPAGIGKTLLLHTFAESISQDALVLACAVASRRHDYGVVNGLLRSMRTADLAIYRDPSEAAERLVTVVEEAAGVTVILVDDAHFADHASLESLAQALVRLRGRPLLLVAAVRTDDDLDLIGERRRTPSELVLPLIGGLEHDKVDVRPLGEDAIAEVLADVGIVGIRTADLARIRDWTDGNPFLITWLAAQNPDRLLSAGQQDLDAPLVARDFVDRTIRADVERLEESGKRLLRALAILGPDTTGSRALDDAASTAGLTSKAALHTLDCEGLRDLVDVDTSPIRLAFPHPLIREAVYRQADEASRQSLHLAAAAVVADQASRLRHLAKAATGPDEPLARKLTDEAERQAELRQWATASDLLQAAADLTPEGPTRDRRAALAVEHLFTGGDSTAGVRRAQAVAPTLSASPWQDYLLGRAALQSGHRERALLLLNSASGDLEDLGDHIPAARAAALVAGIHVNAARPNEGAEAARRSIRLSGTSLEQAQCMRTLALAQQGQYYAAAAELSSDPNGSSVSPTCVDAVWSHGVLALWTDHIADAEAHLEGLMKFTRTHGPFQAYVTTVMYLAETKYRAGKWTSATELGRLAASLADARGHLWVQALTHAVAALPLAAQGEYRAAQRHVDAALSHAQREGDLASVLWARTAAAYLAASRADADAVVSACAPFRDLIEPGARQPGIQPWRQLDIAALIQLGKLHKARESLQILTDEARHTGHATAQLDAARLSLQLAIADPKGTIPNPDAVTQLASQPEVWALHRGLARLQLSRYRHHIGNEPAALADLAKARAQFGALGAKPYLHMADQVEASLTAKAAIEEALRRRGLTARECQVVRLALDGLSNEQIAQRIRKQLTTVEKRLTQAYARLGIPGRSAGRAKLAEAIERLLSGGGADLGQ